MSHSEKKTKKTGFYYHRLRQAEELPRKMVDRVVSSFSVSQALQLPQFN